MSPVKIGVLISGGGSNLQALIDNVENGSINGEIGIVISNKEEAYGLERAKKYGIDNIFLDRKNFESDREYNLKLIDLLETRGVDLVVLAGYLRVLPEEFIRSFRNRIINIHPSLIPSFCGRGYYGKKVHQAVLDYGVKKTGATVHFVDEGTDTGPIILQDVVDVYPGDSVELLQARVLEKEHELLVKAVRYFSEGRISLKGRIVEID